MQKKVGVDPAALSQWCDDLRSAGRLAPKFDKVVAVAQFFGIWPRNDRTEDLRAFWARDWPSWYSQEATDQYSKAYFSLKDGDRKPDSVETFQDEYCKALCLYREDPDSSPLHFPQIDRKKLHDQAAQDLVSVVRKAPHVLAQLQQQLEMETLPFEPVAAQESVDDEAIAKAVKWLLGADIDVVIAACQRAYAKVRRESEAVAIALTELAQRLVPALYESHAVSKIRLALGEEIGGLVELPVHHRTVAEVVVAAAEARATAYLPRRMGEKWPVGARSFIDHTPDSGIESDAKKAQDVRDQLAKPFTAASADALYKAVCAYAAGGQFYRPEPGTNFTDDEKLELAGEMIRNQMKYDGRYFYMMFYLPKGKEDRTKFDELIKKLAKKIPGMLFLALDATKSVAANEIRCFDPFVWMLNDAEGGRS